MRFRATAGLATAALLLTGCETASLPVSAGIGPEPALPPPKPSTIPTVSIPKAVGWPNGARPTPAAGTEVVAFADDLDHPRWIYVLPNGDVLVAETNAPPSPRRFAGIQGWFMKRFMQRAGAAGDSANRITLLRDSDGDGVADQRATFLEGLNSPFGMALVGNGFYVANTDAVLRFPYRDGDIRIAAPGEKIVDLPAGEINYHWTKNLIASADGSRLYVSVGSNSDHGENGPDAERGRAAIWEIDPATRSQRLFAAGLRNPVGMAREPESGRLWASVNERDQLGSDLVPDYMTEVHDGAFYGWPFSYFGDNPDPRLPERPELTRTARVPDYALGPHTSSLGLSNAAGSKLPAPFRNGMFVGQHGSWNRRPPSGYRVIFVPFENGRPAGAPVEVLTGFLSEDGKALGRPVGVAIDRAGGLLVADDVGDVIWRVSATR